MIERGNRSNFLWMVHTWACAQLRSVYWRCMRYAMTIIAVLLCVTVHGCATDKHLTPPDSVLDPRGQ